MRIILLLSLVCCSSLFSQQTATDTIIETLKLKIEKSVAEERLHWMDSLSNVIAYDTDFRNDSIVKETVAYAKALDSFDIAVWHTANLIYHQNNIAGNSKKGKALFEEIRPILKKAKKPKALSKLYYDAANSHFYLTEFERAIQLFDSVYKYAYKDNDFKFMGLSKMGHGQTYTDMGAFGKASLYLQEAIEIFREKQDTTRIMNARNSLAILYSKNEFFEEAKSERDQIIELSKLIHDYNQLPAFYYNAAADSHKLNDQLQRFQNLDSAYAYAKKSRYADFYAPIMISGLSVAYAENDSLEKAIAYKDLLELDLEKNTEGAFKAYYLDVLRNLAFAEKNYKDAITYGEQYLDEKKGTNQYEEIQEASQFLYRTYVKTGDKPKALDYFEAYTTIKDSVESVKKSRVLSYYQTLYETEKRDLTIGAQKSNIALLEAKDKLKTQWLLFGGLGLLGTFGLIFLLRSLNFARRKQKLQKGFTQDLLRTQDEERARIASELHDSVGQKLLIIKNSLAGETVDIEEQDKMVGETIKEVREMSHNLHPFQFEKIGLEQSLKNMVETFQKNSNTFYSEEISDINGLVPKEKEIVIFRMLQECITNVEKHAEATACNLSINKNNGSISFQLKDNGKGFQVSSAKNSADGLGMKTLKERATFIDAELTIDSEKEKGTKVLIKIAKVRA